MAEDSKAQAAPASRATQPDAASIWARFEDATAEDFAAFCRGCLERAEALRGELTQRGVDAEAPTDFLSRYDALAAELDAAGNRSGLFRAVHPNAEVVRAAELCEQEVSRLVTEIELDRALYECFAAIELEGLDAAARRVVEHKLRDFKRAGVHLAEDLREQVRALNEALVEIGQRFSNNIRNDVREILLDGSDPDALAGLPEDYVAAHPPLGEEAGPELRGRIRITTDYPDYIPFMSYARDADARRRLYIESRRRGYPQNLEVLAEMLGRRHELARLLGYESWASYVTEVLMIGSPEAAQDFIDRVSGLAASRAEVEMAELLALKREDEPAATAVEDWEKGYLEERFKARRFGFDARELRPYFVYARVKAGVMALTGELFSIRYEPARDAAPWHPDVEAYDVFPAKGEGGAIGRLYLDMHPRDGKYKHAAMFPLVSGVRGERAPEAALVCNFPGGGAAPGLMEHEQVTTFFHEFGHLLHHLFGGHVPYVDLSGIATEWDFVEAPSQMLEEWAWDVETLQSFARHHETEAPVPAELVRRMRAADEVGKALGVRHQMFYAALSLTYHGGDPEALDSTAVMRELQPRYSPFPHVPDTYFQCAFGHLAGYSAVYYTYMWSLVIAKELFTRFRDGGLMDAEVAEAYRARVLAPGGSRDAAALVESFLGRPYGFEGFEAWLGSGAEHP